jgi:hypothetical protein
MLLMFMASVLSICECSYYPLGRFKFARLAPVLVGSTAILLCRRVVVAFLFKPDCLADLESVAVDCTEESAGTSCRYIAKHEDVVL